MVRGAVTRSPWQYEHMFAIMCSRLSGPHSVPSSEAGPKRRSKAGAHCGARGWCEMSGSLAEAIAAVRQRYGAGALRRGGDPVPATAWSTGMPPVDRLTGVGGLPCGRLVVLAGDPGGGGGGGVPRTTTARNPATGRLTLLQAMTAFASGSMQVAYVDLAGTLDPGFLADLGADLDACLVVRPPGGAVAPGLAMARALAGAGVPWVAIALGRASRCGGTAFEHAITALAGAVEGSRAVACISAPGPLAAPLAYASSLTLACTPLGWQEAHGDVVGLRVRLRTVKSKVGSEGAQTSVLLRYPRPHAVGEVVGLPAVVALPGDGAPPASEAGVAAQGLLPPPGASPAAVPRAVPGELPAAAG